MNVAKGQRWSMWGEFSRRESDQWAFRGFGFHSDGVIGSPIYKRCDLLYIF